MLVDNPILETGDLQFKVATSAKTRPCGTSDRMSRIIEILDLIPGRPSPIHVSQQSNLRFSVLTFGHGGTQGCRQKDAKHCRLPAVGPRGPAALRARKSYLCEPTVPS